MYNDKTVINKFRELLKKQVPAFQKGTTSGAGIGKEITVNVDGKRIKALSYNIVSPGQVNVFYDNTSKKYIAFTENAQNKTKETITQLRKYRAGSDVEDYNFIVAQNGGVLEGFGRNENLSTDDLNLTDYEVVGVNNLGNKRYTLLLKDNDNYILISNKKIVTIGDLNLYSIRDWVGGNNFVGYSSENIQANSTTVDLAGQVFTDVDLPDEFLFSNSPRHIPGAETISGGTVGINFAGSIFGIHAYQATGSPFSFATNRAPGLLPPATNPLRPTPHNAYSGEAVEIIDYGGGQKKETRRQFLHTYAFDPVIDVIDSLGTGSYTSSMVLSMVCNIVIPHEYTVFSKEYPDGKTYTSHTKDFHDWSLTGNNSGSFTADSDFGNIFTDVDSFSGTATDSYNATGSFETGGSTITYVNQTTGLQLANINLTQGSWSKSTTGNTSGSAVITEEKGVIITGTLAVSEVLSTTNEQLSHQIIIESEDCFLTVENKYSTNYEYSSSGTDSLDNFFPTVSSTQYKFLTHEKYAGFNPLLNITLNMIDGNGLAVSHLGDSYTNTAFSKQIFAVYIASQKYVIPIGDHNFFSYNEGFNLPTLASDNTTATYDYIDVDDVDLNVIGRLEVTNARWVTGHRLKTLHTTYTIVGKKVLFVYRNGSTRFEAEGVIVSADENIVTFSTPVNDANPVPYSIGGRKYWTVEGITIAINTDTIKINTFFAYDNFTSEPNYSVIVAKDDFSQMVKNYLYYWGRKQETTLYSVGNGENKTVELAIAQIPPLYSTQRSLKKHYVDIYRFNTNSLKWERRPNAVSPLSRLTEITVTDPDDDKDYDFISYHPKPINKKRKN